MVGIPFRVVKPKGIKETLKPGEEPAAFVRRLALEKALEVARRHPRDLCLGADTVVVYRGLVFGKPGSKRQAAEMLGALSGHRHEVLTGVALVGNGGRKVKRHLERTHVTFKRIPRREMEAYLATPEPYDKAGAYGIQGRARNWIADWNGDFLNVMGLPVHWVIRQINF